MKGARIVIECLLKEGVDALFGYPGGQVIPFFDALYDAPLKFYLVRHEQAAAHAADGYARLTGKVGVCVATSGPGATNLTTGIATAYMDSIPMVAITGQVKTSLIGNDAFQEADITGVTRSISKHNFLIKNIKDLAPTIKQAFYIARTGRPGPVVVDLPSDVQLAECEFSYPESVTMRSYQPTYTGHPGQIKRALKLIEKAQRPLIIAGGGVISSGAAPQLRQFAEKINAPVTTTLLALGAFPATHPLSLGMPGMHGTAYANLAITECDVLISVGCRFDDRVTGKVDAFAPEAKIIHIDIDPTSISKSIAVDIPIVGDAKQVLTDMLAEGRKMKVPSTAAWLKRVNDYKKKHPLRYARSSGYIKPQYVIEELYRQTKGRAVIVTEVGQHQMWTAQFYKFDYPRQFLSSGGLGTMGYGFPASIGAKIADPSREVVTIAGDGSIQMNIQELATVKQYDVAVKVIILNNGYLGMVRQWQELFYHHRYSATKLYNPDFVKLAQAYGVKGLRVKKEGDVKKAVKEILASRCAVVADFMVEPEENVFPMVPAGEAINRMIEGMA